MKIGLKRKLQRFPKAFSGVSKKKRIAKWHKKHGPNKKKNKEKKKFEIIKRKIEDIRGQELSEMT